MTTSSLSLFYNTDHITEIIQDLEAAKLAQDLEASVHIDIDSAFSTLRIAAISAITDFIGDGTLDSRLRQQEIKDEEEQELKQIFTQWQSYLDAFAQSSQSPEIDDLVIFAFVGLLAERPNEVRDFLRRPIPREWINRLRTSIDTLSWLDRVRAYISLAVILVIRQENHTDVQDAGEIMRHLAEIQKGYESEWLEERSNPKRDAMCLLGYYHVAQAVLRTSEFLLVGSVRNNDGRIVSDFAPELRRLLVRAEEFLENSSDSEALLWLKAIGLTLMKLRQSSIWVQAKGISARIDQLIDEITATGRGTPLFSLLPSQEDALRKSLLDRSRVAIILQMPTSAGKTLLAEFSIAQTFDAYQGRTRVVYVVPTRALATQVRRTLTEDLGPLGINVSAAGSAFEEDPYELKLLQDSDGVVVATPEKLDLMLRIHPEWFNDLRLVVVDEAHLLGDGDRGVRLELLLANIRREQPEARLLLLTPFMENVEQIAAWLSQDRSRAISVHWRPAKILLGIADISGRGAGRKLTIEWKNPFLPTAPDPKPLSIHTSVSSRDVQSNLDRTVFLAKRFRRIGTSLALFSAEPGDAEKAAIDYSENEEPLATAELSPQLRIAIALARHEYGNDSPLARCLERGIAFHHSALSPIMRYLIEDQVRAKTIKFVAATSTLAQGMNFPVATIFIHSVHKPYGKGNFSIGEFWNIAGRAGRVGMAEKGLVVFVNKTNHQAHFQRYSDELSQTLRSALLLILKNLSPDGSLKDQYRDYPELRPFIQYLAHAAANTSPASAMANIEELLQQSLANQQVTSSDQARKLRDVALAYLQGLTKKNLGFLKVSDSTGLGSFSFDDLYKALQKNSILKSGPQAVLSNREAGLYQLVDVLRWMPELDLAIGTGRGQMDVQAVANLIQGWIDGKQVHELSDVFSGSDEDSKIRKAASYLYSKVSQTISWGAHAYLRGWGLGRSQNDSPPEEAMLPAYIQYGVRTPEAAVASLLGVPRPFAEAFGHEFRKSYGSLEPSQAPAFKQFIESADDQRWNAVVQRAEVESINPADIRSVVRQMQGLPG